MSLVGHGRLPQHIIQFLFLTILIALLSCYPVSDQIQKRGAVTHLTNATSNATVINNLLNETQVEAKSSNYSVHPVINGAAKNSSVVKDSVKKDDIESVIPAIEEGASTGSDQAATSDKPAVEQGELESGTVKDVVDEPAAADAVNGTVSSPHWLFIYLFS